MMDWLRGIRWMKVYEGVQKFNSRLFTAWGVPVMAHWTLWLIMLFLLLASPEKFVIFSLVILSVIPHEYGHVLMAKHYGIKCRKIVMTPVGGLAMMTSIPKQPKVEFMVAVAGPAVTAAIVAAVAAPAYFFGGAFATLFAANVGLLIFNLLPIFPMDGGRVLRCGLAAYFSYLKATQIAVWISKVACALLLALGVAAGNPGLVVTAVFLYLLSDVEYSVTEQVLQAEKLQEEAKAELEKRKERLVKLAERKAAKKKEIADVATAPQV